MPVVDDSAIPSAVAASAQAVVQIDHRGEGGGSGTYIGDGLVITCDHLFRGRAGARSIGRIVVSFPNGRASEAKLLKQDSVWDLAVLRLAYVPVGVTPVRWALKIPVRGEKLVTAGYGPRGAVRWSVGRLSGFGGPKEHSSYTGTADTLIVTGGVRGGDSGGPIFNRNGRLAGVLWGSNDRETVGSQVARCKLFLRGLRRRSVVVSPPLKPVPAVEARVEKCDSQLVEIRQLIAANAAAIAAVAAKEPVPGPKGDAGPKGDRGEPASKPVPIPESVAHAVVVVDRKTSWWTAFEPHLIRAQEHYQRIDVVDRPDYDVGTIPQMVIYKSGDPIKVVRGTYAVLSELAMVSRQSHPLLK